MINKLIVSIFLLLPIYTQASELAVLRCSKAIPTVYEMSLKTNTEEYYLSKEYTFDIPKELLSFHKRLVTFIFSQNIPADVMTGMFLTECIRKNADPDKIFLFKQS